MNKRKLLSRIYSSQKQHSKDRGHNCPQYSLDDLIVWANTPMFDSMYLNWINSKMESCLSPSVDRIDDNIGYTLSNIQLMTWGKNRKKANDARNLKNKIPVVQISKDGSNIVEHDSSHDAERKTGVFRNNITACCKGRLNTAGGFIWRYREEFAFGGIKC